MDLKLFLWTQVYILLVKEFFGLPDESGFPLEHLEYYGYRTEEKCHAKGDCKEVMQGKKKCWGYEKNCTKDNQFSEPECYEHQPPWARNLEDQRRLFWEQGDFGYIKKKKSSLIRLCRAVDDGDSSLECTKNLEFCRAKNMFINLENFVASASNNRYREDLFQKGDLGGHCLFDASTHSKQNECKSPLQSWYAELEHYTALPFKPSAGTHCDVTVSRPTIFMKLDAGINMYHHFCDFINLYGSQHINGSFSTDVQIIMWDTSDLQYGDYFADTWKAFSRYPIKRLQDFEGKKICFKDAMFPLLARLMRGLYYNMPLVPGCWKSGLFKAFSEHILHRLGIKQDHYKKEKLRITILARNTPYRNILNQDELVGAMKRLRAFDVSVVEYNWNMPFLDQLKMTHNTDIFIGMHGAGLTHLLFLPDWAVIFELYNTEDPDCYKDLANLRGVKYFTWRRKEKLFQQDEGHHPTLGAHPKFTNYAFHVDEFMRIIFEAATYVMQTRNEYIETK